MRAVLLALLCCPLMAAAPSDCAYHSFAHRRSSVPSGRSASPIDAAPTISSDGKLAKLLLEQGRACVWEGAMAAAPQTAPVAFLEESIQRYQRDVSGFTLTMQKQEFIGGQLQKKEIVKAAFRDEPHSVYMEWIEGARKAERVLYVEDENEGKMLARPTPLLRKLAGDIVARDVDSADARSSGRLTMNEFGLKKAMLRTLTSWQAAASHGTLHIDYQGEQSPKETGGRPCYVLRRTQYAHPEADGVTELTIYVDKETLLQVGSIATGEGGKIIGEYYFRDIVLNPEFAPGQFTRAALKP
jgi:Protein of unknown function (DUF1571)